MQLVELNELEYKEFTSKNKAHFLESYEWGIISKYRGYKVYYLGLKDKEEVKASALVLEKKLLFGYTYFYIPRSFTINYKDKELLMEMVSKLKEFAKSKKVIFIRIDPAIKLHTIDENANVIDGENNYDIVDNLKNVGFKHLKLTKYFETNQPRFTFRIPLKNSLEEIEKRYSSTTKSRIKKAINSCAFVEIGNKNDVKEFSRLMKLTEKRQDFYSHNSEFFEKFYEVFNKNDMVTLYLGKIDLLKLSEKLEKEKEVLEEEYNALKDIDSKKNNNKRKEIEKNLISIKTQLDNLENKPKKTIVVSSYLIVKYNDMAWALYAANDMNYKTLYVNYLVYQTQIKDCFEEGIKVFDVFGTIGDPNGNSSLLGLHDFKKKWGGEYTEFIGEFDLILNKFMYFIYTKLIPIYHNMVNKKLKKEVK
ncbi:MAG: peptidoglycan bridge formation glycyltransferase FemA/FemB family protein [Bacilli bacterium]|nr:peptidoglycan bridge formation glycyltransferase FemA/FemB family protein [Bacilli bacterium]